MPVRNSHGGIARVHKLIPRHRAARDFRQLHPVTNICGAASCPEQVGGFVIHAYRGNKLFGVASRQGGVGAVYLGVVF